MNEISLFPLEIGEICRFLHLFCKNSRSLLEPENRSQHFSFLFSKFEIWIPDFSFSSRFHLLASRQCLGLSNVYWQLYTNKRSHTRVVQRRRVENSMCRHRAVVTVALAWDRRWLIERVGCTISLHRFLFFIGSNRFLSTDSKASWCRVAVLRLSGMSLVECWSVRTFKLFPPNPSWWPAGVVIGETWKLVRVPS